MLGRDFQPALRAATEAIAEQVRHELTPYPPATIANSPSNPNRRWYERGYGPRWLIVGGAVHGRKTSQMLNRSWGVIPVGTVGHRLGTRVTYAPFLHSAKRQARWAGARGWVTDDAAIRKVVSSGAVQRIVMQAIMGALTRR